jgi:hypothetical protein
MAFRPSGRFGKEWRQIQSGQHVVKVFGHLRHHHFASLGAELQSAQADALQLT